MWCWIRLLRVPWTARRSNQSILKEINSEYSLDGLMLKLKLQYFGLPMQRAYSLEKSLVLGKTEGKRRRGQQRIRWLDGIINSVDMSWSKLWEVVKGSLVCCRPHGVSQRVGHDLMIEQQPPIWRTALNPKFLCFWTCKLCWLIKRDTTSLVLL